MPVWIARIINNNMSFILTKGCSEVDKASVMWYNVITEEANDETNR